MYVEYPEARESTDLIVRALKYYIFPEINNDHIIRSLFLQLFLVSITNHAYNTD